jgi:hypothetical protein
MEKKWLLRLPKDLDDWLTLKAAEETVLRGKRVSKNTLMIELASTARAGKEDEATEEQYQPTVWHDVKSALEYIKEAIVREGDLPSEKTDRLKQRVSVNLRILESYLEELEQ